MARVSAKIQSELGGKKSEAPSTFMELEDVSVYESEISDIQNNSPRFNKEAEKERNREQGLLRYQRTSHLLHTNPSAAGAKKLLDSGKTAEPAIVTAYKTAKI